MPDASIPEAPDAYVVFDGADLPEPDEEAREIDAPKYVRTERAPYASPPGQMDAMWDTARRDRDMKLRKVDRGGEIVMIGLAPLPLPTKPKALLKRMLLADWEVDERSTAVEIAPSRYAGRGADHEPGDVKVPGHMEYRWSVHAALRSKGQPVAWFWATWHRNDAAAKPGNSFEDALTWDVVLGRGYESTATGFEEWLSVFAPKA